MIRQSKMLRPVLVGDGMKIRLAQNADIISPDPTRLASEYFQESTLNRELLLDAAAKVVAEFS